MKTSPLLRGAALAVLTTLTLTAGALAQTTATWIGALSNATTWTNNADWSGGVFPNSSDSVAIFTNTAGTNSWETNITIGRILASNASGSVILGVTATNTDLLTLATSTGKPEINVASNNGTVFIYANVEGTNGFTKNGGGNLSFRFNGDDMGYTGDVLLNAGTLTVNQATSLGGASNSLIVGGTSTLSISPGNNAGNIIFGATRSFVVSNGVTFNIQTTSNNISATFSNTLTGGGRVDFIGRLQGASTNVYATYNLFGANTLTGRTTVQLGSAVILGSGSSIGTGELNLSGGAATNTGVLNLGGNTQSVSFISPASSPATNRVWTITNGTLNVGSGGSFSWNGTNSNTVDMAGLTTFTFAGSTNRNFVVTPNGSTSTNVGEDNTNYVLLANTGLGSNNITGATMTIGGASGSPTNNNQARLLLGKINEINFTDFVIGGFNGSGVVDFLGSVTNGSLRIRGNNGADRLPRLVVGATTSGARSGAGTLNISNGTIDGSISNTFLGTYGANATGPATTSQITMGGGTFDTLNMLVSAITNATITNASATTTGTFQQNGGTVTVQTLTLGDSSATSNVSAPTFLANYNLSSSNAVLKAQTIRAGTTTTNYSASTRRKINFGAGRIETYDASTDLVIQGNDTTAQGRIEIAVASNAQTKTFFADTGRKITLEPSAVLTFDGGITKEGAGTLVLKGANVHNGDTTVAAGTLELQSTGSLRFQITGPGTNNKVNGAGTATLDGAFVFNLASASTNTNSTWTIVSNSLTATYGTNFLVTGFNGSVVTGLWTNTTNGVNYIFAQSNGVLSVQSTGAPTPYNAWVAYWQTNSAGFTNTAGTDNPDGDPYDNNMEFAFDGNPTVGSPALLTATKSGTNTIFNYVALTNTNAATYLVQIITNLATGTWNPASVTISNSTNQGGISQTNIYERKEFVVPSTATEFYRVKASITP